MLTDFENSTKKKPGINRIDTGYKFKCKPHGYGATVFRGIFSSIIAV